MISIFMQTSRKADGFHLRLIKERRRTLEWSMTAIFPFVSLWLILLKYSMMIKKIEFKKESSKMLMITHAVKWCVIYSPSFPTSVIFMRCGSLIHTRDDWKIINQSIIIWRPTTRVYFPKKCNWKFSRSNVWNRKYKN